MGVAEQNPVDESQFVACFTCGEYSRGLQMYAHRNTKGLIVGWIFACSRHGEQVAGQELFTLRDIIQHIGMLGGK